MKTVKMFLVFIGALALIAGSYFFAIAGFNSGIGPTLLLFGFILFVFPYLSLRTDTMKTRIIGVASGHKKITLQELAEKAGYDEVKTRQVIYDAIAKGNLSGTMEGDVFERGSKASGATVEREVLVARKIPETCFKCGAAINPKDVEWVGPDSVRCTHCEATLAVSTERI